MTEQDRNHIRIRLNTRIFVEVVAATDSSEGLMVLCQVLDVSYAGFRVSIECELIQGAILSVCAELPGVEEPFYMASEVMWCRPDEDAEGRWIAGFHLLNSSDTDIESWRSLLEHI